MKRQKEEERKDSQDRTYEKVFDLWFFHKLPIHHQKEQ